MTAWAKYERLEAPGLWRPGAGAQRREMIVSFGTASLVIADRNEVALAHWSLPALIRLNPGQAPALYAPGREADETLEIADPAMIEAVETVRRALARDRPRAGRVRLIVAGGVALLLAAIGWVWLPGALVAYTTGVVPDEQRARLARDLMTEVTALTGPPCDTPRGAAALDGLARGLLGAGRRAAILPQGVPGAVLLPDGTVLLDSRLVEDHEGPEVAAAYLLREALRRELHDPLAVLLQQAGTGPTLRLLTSGNLPRPVLRARAEALLREPPPLPQAAFLARLGAAGVPSTPYARTLDPTGETVLELIEADPYGTDPAPPLLPDADWIALQQICEE
jgi:hypothetical protein